MMNHDVFETLAAGYAVGALDGEDLVRFERHLAEGCARCAATLKESGEALAGHARSLPPEAPPPHVRTALLERIGTPSGARRATGRAPRLAWAIGTAAAVVAGAALSASFVAGRYEARLGQMARETSALRHRLERQETTLREQIVLYRSAVDLLRDPATEVVLLRGIGPTSGATGRIVWNATSGGYVFIARLAPAPAGKTYELWAFAGAVPRPAGVFQVDASGRGSHPIAASPGGPPVKAFAVTLEPEGGTPAPTGPVVLASK